MKFYRSTPIVPACVSIGAVTATCAMLYLLTGCNAKQETSPTSAGAKNIVSKLTPDEMAQASALFGTGGTPPATTKNGRTLTEQERATLADSNTPMSKKLEIYYSGASLTGRVAPASSPSPAGAK